MSDVTRILSAIEQGDPHAAEQLFPLVYDELRTLAAQKLAREKPGQTLQATKLISAMSQRRMGDCDKARSEWGEASRFCSGWSCLDRGQLLHSSDWHDGIGMELLLREANQLFETPAPAESEPLVDEAAN